MLRSPFGPRPAPAVPADEAPRDGLEHRLRRRLAPLLEGRRVRVVAFVLGPDEVGAASDGGFASLRLDGRGGAERRLHAGDPAAVIARCAAEEDDALIALVTDPADGYEHLYRASVALDVMQRCGAAVLLLPLSEPISDAPRPPRARTP